MGAWNFTTRLVLFVVFLNKGQALEAIPYENCSHGLQRDILQDLLEILPKATEEDAQVVIDFRECSAKWRATVGEPCIFEREFEKKWNRIYSTHWGDIPWSEFKTLAGQVCKKDLLICSAARECEWKDSTVVSSTCDLSENPKWNLVRNCDKENKALVDLVLGKTNLFMMAVIISFVLSLGLLVIIPFIRFVVTPLCTRMNSSQLGKF